MVKLELLYFLSCSDCGNPGDVANAVRTQITGTTIGSQATYQCNTGFVVQGFTGVTTSVIACQSNGQWSARPVCVRSATTGRTIFPK